MDSPAQDRLRLTPQEVAVEAAQGEIKARKTRLEEVQAELAELRASRDRYNSLYQETLRLEKDIAAYTRIVESKGKESFDKASRSSTCVV